MSEMLILCEDDNFSFPLCSFLAKEIHIQDNENMARVNVFLHE